MRAQEFLKESQGGLMRRAQEVAQGKTITFAKDNHKINLIDAVVIPEAPELRYETQEELNLALKELLASKGNPQILFSTKIMPKHGAALVTFWKDEKNKTYAFVKYANAKLAGAFPILWANSDFTRDTGYVQSNSKIAERAQFNLKPNALFKTDAYIPVVGLANSIAERTDLPPEVTTQVQQLLSNVEQGSREPVPGAGQYLSTYEIDLGESAAPIALVTGNFVSGAYQEAEQALLAPLGLTWQNIKNVLFPGAGSNLLYDSYLQLNNTTNLKVSSKDKKGGAAASVTGLIKEIETTPERFAEITENPEYQKILNIVDIVAKNNAVDGPLKLAVKFRIISAEEMGIIKSHWGKGEKFAKTVPWIKTPGIQSALIRKGAKFQDPAYDLGFHVLAGVAELVADKLNKIKGIDSFFRAILERSTMIQVKAAMQKSGDGATYSNFTVIYPPVFEGGIKVVAGNNYMATRKPIGKISFKIG